MNLNQACEIPDLYTKNIDLFRLIKDLCVRCNEQHCICPTAKETARVISNIKETRIKKDKWITEVYGNVEKDAFLALKSEIGTGGNIEKDYLYLRGRVSNRAKNILQKIGFKILNSDLNS